MKEKGTTLKVFLSGATLFPLPASLILEMAAKAGFDGVEIFLFGTWTEKKIEQVKERASSLGLGLHFHVVWSCEESTDSSMAFKNRLMTLFGLLPKDGYIFQDWYPKNALPLIPYANRYWDRQEGYWFQTLSVKSLSGAYCVPWHQFMEDVVSASTPVVFDTMHFLEYSTNVFGVHKLADRDPERILQMWQWAWKKIGHLVKEVHLNDFDPALGEKAGRNLFPGTGVAPLKRFADYVKATGWDGIVVPEVVPGLRYHSHERLCELRNKVDTIFS